MEPALDIRDRVTTDADPLAPVFAEQFAAAFRKLPGVEGAFAQPLRPIGNKRAMRRSGHRIFGNAGLWREEA